MVTPRRGERAVHACLEHSPAPASAMQADAGDYAAGASAHVSLHRSFPGSGISRVSLHRSFFGREKSAASLPQPFPGGRIRLCWLASTIPPPCHQPCLFTQIISPSSEPPSTTYTSKAAPVFLKSKRQ